MSDGINLKARIHNTVLLLNDTPLFHRQFATIGKPRWKLIVKKYYTLEYTLQLSCNDRIIFSLDANYSLLDENSCDYQRYASNFD